MSEKTRFPSLFDRKRTVANQRVFLDDRNCLRSGARFHDHAETHLMAGLLAQLHRLGILIEQRSRNEPRLSRITPAGARKCLPETLHRQTVERKFGRCTDRPGDFVSLSAIRLDADC